MLRWTSSPQNIAVTAGTVHGRLWQQQRSPRPLAQTRGRHRYYIPPRQMGLRRQSGRCLSLAVVTCAGAHGERSVLPHATPRTRSMPLCRTNRQSPNSIYEPRRKAEMAPAHALSPTAAERTSSVKRFARHSSVLGDGYGHRVFMSWSTGQANDPRLPPGPPTCPHVRLPPACPRSNWAASAVCTFFAMRRAARAARRHQSVFR